MWHFKLITLFICLFILACEDPSSSALLSTPLSDQEMNEVDQKIIKLDQQVTDTDQQVTDTD